MGLDAAAVKFLCGVKSAGVDFASLAMIGRQMFFMPHAGALRRVFAALNVSLDADSFLREHDYCEPFFALLGAKEIVSVDASDYEEASHVHDMNQPLPEDLRHRFTIVYEGGSLEHIFNIPQALKNCLEMVQVGGHFVQLSVANNFMGHGFWQFSPELIFRVCSPTNGYDVETVLLHEVVPNGPWYVVSDPETLGCRVELCNRRPTYILTVAKRVREADIFAAAPQQSDYATSWSKSAAKRRLTGSQSSTPRSSAPARRSVRRFLPPAAKHLAKVMLERLRAMRYSAGLHAPYYRRISEDALMLGRWK